MRHLTLISAAALTAASSLGAQGTVAPAKPDSTCTKFSDGRVECRIIRGRSPGDSLRTRVFFRNDSAMRNRAALGLELRPTGTRRDTLGVFVTAVTRNGPAETAGIIEGDRIAAINGVDVRSAAGDVDDPYTNGLASHRLSREVRKLTPGSRVTLRVYSGGRYRDVQVTAGRASEVMRQAGRFNILTPGEGGAYWFGPGSMEMFGPDMSMLRQRLENVDPKVIERLEERLEKVEPQLRRQLELLPRRLELRGREGMRRSGRVIYT